MLCCCCCRLAPANDVVAAAKGARRSYPMVGGERIEEPAENSLLQPARASRNQASSEILLRSPPFPQSFSFPSFLPSWATLGKIITCERESIYRHESIYVNASALWCPMRNWNSTFWNWNSLLARLIILLYIIFFKHFRTFCGWFAKACPYRSSDFHSSYN